MNESKDIENKGLRYVEAGDDRKALELFRNAVLADRLNYSAVRNLLFAAHRLGLTQDALATLKDLLSENSGDARMLAIAQEFIDTVHGKQTEKIPLTVIFLSKDRPLQLQGCLESLMHHSGIPRENIVVLFKQTGNIYYDLLFKRYPEIQWVPEKNFSHDIRALFEVSQDYIFMCCDDMIFTEPFDLGRCIEVLDQNPDIFNFTLRVGLNVTPLPEDLVEYDDWLKWKWFNPVAVRWHYPWSVPSSVYRKSEVLRLTQPFVFAITNPNFLESTVAQYLQNYPDKAPASLAGFRHSKVIATHVNRVQDTHCNEYDTSGNTETEELYRLFLGGHCLNWEKVANIDNPDFNLGGEYFSLKLAKPSHGFSTARKVRGLMPFNDPYDRFNFVAMPKNMNLNGAAPDMTGILGDTTPNMTAVVNAGKGEHAIRMASYLQKQGADGAVICIDTWLGSFTDMVAKDPSKSIRNYYVHGYPSLYYQFLANVMHCGVQDYIVPLPNSADIAARWLLHHDIRPGLIYVCAGNEEGGEANSAALFWSILAPDGKMAGTMPDRGPGMIEESLGRIARDNGGELTVQGKEWILQKKK
jgi:hypothetical protein